MSESKQECQAAFSLDFMLPPRVERVWVSESSFVQRGSTRPAALIVGNKPCQTSALFTISQKKSLICWRCVVQMKHMSATLFGVQNE